MYVTRHQFNYYSIYVVCLRFCINTCGHSGFISELAWTADVDTACAACLSVWGVCEKLGKCLHTIRRFFNRKSL